MFVRFRSRSKKLFSTRSQNYKNLTNQSLRKDRTMYEDMFTMSFFTALLPVVTGGTQKDFFVVLFCFSYKKLLEIPAQYTFYPFSFYNINAILFTDYYMKNGGIFCS